MLKMLLSPLREKLTELHKKQQILMLLDVSHQLWDWQTRNRRGVPLVTIW